MHSGLLLQINITPIQGGLLHSVEQALVKAGIGIEGDRYYEKAGTFSLKTGKPRDVTLIEIESLEALKRNYDIVLSAAESRRNLLTKDVSLNDLVNKNFKVGDIAMRGIELCEPCSHLEKLCNKAVRRPLMHRAGLRAQILNDGILRVKDPIFSLLE